MEVYALRSCWVIKLCSSGFTALPVGEFSKDRNPDLAITEMDELSCSISINERSDAEREVWRKQEVEGESTREANPETVNERETVMPEEYVSRQLPSSGSVESSERDSTHNRELLQQNLNKGSGFSSRNDSYDIRQNSSGKLYKCEQCDSVFNQKSNLKRHQKLHSGYKPFICKECGLSFYEQVSLKKHSRTHTGEKPYKCEVCNTSFAHNGHLKTHKRIHSGEKPFACQECGLSFSQAGNLKVHIRVHTGERPYICKTCGAAFSISSVYKKHIMVHTGERPFKCSFCDARFSSNSNLSRHNKTHTGEKPFKCQICSAAFPVKNSLDRHMKSHTGERPYCCEMCGTVFADMSDLTKHRKIHTGEKPLKCDICGMGFFSKSQMKIHIRTHTGEKPHKCILCGVSFAQIGTLNKHKRTHTGEKPFRCDECGSFFTAKSSLKKHVERHAYNASPQRTNTSNISDYRNVESHIAPFCDNQNKILSDSNVCNQETLPLSSRLLGVPSLTSSVEIDGVPVPLNTNSNTVTPKRTLPLSSNNTLLVISSSIPEDHSALISMDIGNSTQMSQNVIAGGRFPVYNSSLRPVDITVPEPTSTLLCNPATFEARSTPALSFSDLQNETEFCNLERSSTNINSSASTTLQSLPTVPAESCVQSALTASAARLSSAQKCIYVFAERAVHNRTPGTVGHITY
ncbi:zinc finger protein 25 isoform X1 [Procambarus clarkii]|uniref:zinc finger protein 25 isoform X1 n=2 Tax=Procambarus clarkii TaxID=6728 RepID=UPI003743817F